GNMVGAGMVGLNQGGAVNLGVGGGMLGIGGGALGQLGNLGGQFGIQGNNQSQLLVTLIRQVVGRPKDWAVAYNPVTGEPLRPEDDNQAEGALNQDNNNLGYYPPALALVVKAPSMVHTRASNLVITGGGMGDTVALPGGGRVFVDGRPVKPKVNVA